MRGFIGEVEWHESAAHHTQIVSADPCHLVTGPFRGDAAIGDAIALAWGLTVRVIDMTIYHRTLETDESSNFFTKSRKLRTRRALRGYHWYVTLGARR